MLRSPWIMMWLSIHINQLAGKEDISWTTNPLKGADALPTQEAMRREAPRTRVTVGIVSFVREHLKDRDWKTLKWTRQPDTFLCRACDSLERERSGSTFHMGYQGFMLMLNDWPDNEFVEDEERRKNNRVFREEWEAMRATGCIGDNEGDHYRLNHFDHVRSDDEDEDQKTKVRSLD